MVFNGDSATFTWNEQSIFTGTYLTAQFTTGAVVPEPGTFAIWSVLAATGLVVSKRRRKV